MKNVLGISSLIILAAASSLYAQDSVMAVSENKYVHIDFAAGYLRTDLHSINSSLAGFGYKPINENFLTLSMAGDFCINRLVLRFELTRMFANTSEQANNLKTRFLGYSLMAGIGYAVIQKPKFRLYPFVDLISYVNRLEFEDSSPVENMNGVINTPHRSSTLLFSNASFDIGVQIDRITGVKNRKWDCPQNSRSNTVGLRLGYNFGPGPVRGRYNGVNNVTDAPSYSLKGPYMKLTYGFGYKVRDLKWRK